MTKQKVDTIEKLAVLVAEGFESVDLRLDSQSHQIDRVGERIERVEKRLEHLEVDNRDVKESLRHISHDAGEMKDELRAVARAVDKDATTIIAHGNRITRQEGRIKKLGRVL